MKNKYNQLSVSAIFILGSLFFAFIFMSSCKKDENNDHAIAQIQQEYSLATNADNALVLYTDSLNLWLTNHSMPHDSTYYTINIYRCDSLYHFYDSNMMNQFRGLQNGGGGMMGNNLNFTINGMQCLNAFELLHNTHATHHPL